MAWIEFIECDFEDYKNKPWMKLYNNYEVASASYYNRLRGCKSHNLLIRVLDFLCSRQGSQLTIFAHLFSVNASLSIFVYFPLTVCCGLYHDPDYHLYVFIYVCVNFGIFFFAPQDYYRYFRHRYFKKHNLPGTYGWGTLDTDWCSDRIPVEGVFSPGVLYYFYNIFTYSPK